MLYGTPALEAADEKVLAEIEEMRRDLKYRLAEAHRWDGLLRRQLQARAIQGSNSIEGYHASVEDIESIMSGEDPLETSTAVAREIAGYRQALTYIGTLSRAWAFPLRRGPASWAQLHDDRPPRGQDAGCGAARRDLRAQLRHR